MTKFWLLLVLTVSIAQTLDDQIVPCPTDDQKFAQCFICKSSHESKGKIYCACLNQQFKMLGSCLQPQYPCDLILTNLMYDQKDKDKGFNIWDHKVSALLQWKFQEAMKTQTFPDPLPQYVNEMDFLGMPEAFRQGWGQVYFLYASLQNQIKQLDNNAQDALVVDGIKFFQQIKDYKYEQQWAQINKFVNEKLHLHWNLSEFQQIIGQRISHIIPCHQCSLLYGFLFIKSEMKCYKCPPACTTCTNNTSDCVSCLQGYFLNQSSRQCQPCSIAHCSNCTSQGTCSKCEGNLILYQNFCYHADSYCSSNCQNCQPGNPSHCTACSIFDYSLQPNKDTKKCFKCDHDDCMMCRPENTTFCLECLRGFYAGQNGACVRCMDDCLVCEGEQNCSVCRYGFSIHNNKCTACLVPGCKYCKDDPKLCSECLTEKLVLNPANKTCHLYQGATLNYHILEPVLNCSRGCLFCYNNNTQQCHTCQVRYFLDVKARVCRRCISGCIQCLDENSCIDCESGYYLHEHQCLNCTGPHCQCGNDGKCYRCYDGYEFKQGVCTLVAQPYGCMHFDAQNSSVCKICEPGFAKTLQDKCIQCESHCKLSCNPHNVSQCRQSRYQMVRPYYIFSLKEDQTCIYINGNCIVPKDGYEIREINGTFVSHRVCFHPCHECDLDFVCTKCKPGYLLSDGACTPDISCNPKCQHCLSGSHRDSQTHNCVLCSEPHCNACINTTTCVQCNEGFYLQKLQASTHCKKCIQSCKICMNQIDCQTCAVGYFQLANMKCQKCNENCLTCQHLRTKCLSCRPGSRLLGNRCIGVHSVQFYYRIKGDPKQFKHNVKSEAFILEISKLLNISKEEIYLLNTTQTPLSISGLVSAPTQASSSKMFTHLQQPGIQNFQVLCHSLSHLHETQKIGYYSNLQSTCQKKQDDDDNDDEKGGLGAGAIVAIVLCCIIASIVVVIGVIKAIRKLKSRNSWSTQHSQSHQLSQGSDNYYQQYMDAN